jgi:hypothetical protein
VIERSGKAPGGAKVFSKLTKIFAAMVIVLGVFVVAAEYKDFRHYYELRAQWRGQEKALELLEPPPKAPPPVQAAFSIAIILLLATFASAAIDIRQRRSQG